jgi:hypothetical protein
MVVMKAELAQSYQAHARNSGVDRPRRARNEARAGGDTGATVD